MGELIRHLVARVDEFQGIDPERIRISASFNRSRSRGGVLAYVLPLRYRDGVPVELRRHGERLYHWAMVPLTHEGREILYYIYFMLPRFLNLPFREKVETIVHELYHIHPTFNGDLRRFKGRSATHGSSREFDRKVRQMTDRFFDSTPDPAVLDFLRGGPLRLRVKYGDVRAHHWPEPKPKLLKVTSLTGAIWGPAETGFEPDGLPSSAV